MLDQREREHALLAFHADTVFQAFLEELERGQIARAQPQRLHVEHLHYGDETQAAPPYSRAPQSKPSHERTRSIRPAGQAQRSAPFRFGPRHAAAIGLVIHAQQVQHAVQHQNLDLLLDA